MLNIIFLLLVLITFGATTAQTGFLDEEKYKKNAIFLEAGGHGLVASFNYEAFFTRKIGIRLGIGNVFLYGFSYPILINYYVGNDNNKLELGAGLIFLNGKLEWDFVDKNESALFGATIGLRHQKPVGGIIIRVSFTPLYNPKTNKFMPYGGLSLGFCF